MIVLFSDLYTVIVPQVGSLTDSWQTTMFGAADVLQEGERQKVVGLVCVLEEIVHVAGNSQLKTGRSTTR